MPIRVSLRIENILDSICTVAMDELRAMMNQTRAINTIKIPTPKGIETNPW